MATRVALYVRVSTDGQTADNQRGVLLDTAASNGWEVALIFADEGISGAKGRDQRPGYNALCKAIARREVDMVAVWSVDRLGRSVQDLVTFCLELNAKGVGLFCFQQGMDTTTPAGRAMFQMIGVFAEFERAMIVERVRAGLKRAKKEGRTGGRPRVSANIELKIRTGLRDGVGIRNLARQCDVGTSVVQRIASELKVSTAAT